MARIPRTAGRPRLGLAFGGGLPFGVSAIGVLEVLESHGIQIDCVAGTSMGSIVGLLYAYGYKPQDLGGHFAQFFKRKNLFATLLHDVRFSRTGFVHGDHIIRTLGKLVPETVCFEDLRIPFAAPAADLVTGQEVVFHRGPVLPAVRASISMPGIFTPVPWGGTHLVDGAIITPIPVHLLARLGADVRIPVRAIRQTGTVSRQRMADTRETATAPPGPAPDLLRLMWRSMSLILQDNYADAVMAQSAIAIRPEIPTDFAASPDRLEEIIAIGRAEAERHVPAIKAALAAHKDGARVAGVRGTHATAPTNAAGANRRTRR